MLWKPASTVFAGGTEAVRALKGRRVETVHRMQPNLFEGEHRPMGAPVTIEARRIGFVANPFRDGLIIAFPEGPPVPGQTLDQLARRGRFTSVFVSYATFRSFFRVE